MSHGAASARLVQRALPQEAARCMRLVRDRGRRRDRATCGEPILKPCPVLQRVPSDRRQLAAQRSDALRPVAEGADIELGREVTREALALMPLPHKGGRTLLLGSQRRQAGSCACSTPAPRGRACSCFRRRVAFTTVWRTRVPSALQRRNAARLFDAPRPSCARAPRAAPPVHYHPVHDGAHHLLAVVDRGDGRHRARVRAEERLRRGSSHERRVDLKRRERPRLAPVVGRLCARARNRACELKAEAARPRRAGYLQRARPRGEERRCRQVTPTSTTPMRYSPTAAQTSTMRRTVDRGQRRRVLVSSSQQMSTASSAAQRWCRRRSAARWRAWTGCTRAACCSR